MQVRLAVVVACAMVGSGALGGCYSPPEPSGSSYVGGPNDLNSDSSAETKATPSPGVTASPTTTAGPSGSPSPVDLCPFVEDYPSSDPNTPWAATITSLAGCDACLSVAPQLAGTPILVTACNDSQAQQYWHWGTGQLFLETAKNLCMASQGSTLVLQPCSSPNTQFRYKAGNIIDIASSLCMQSKGLNAQVAMSTCADDPNQQFAVAHAKIARLVGSNNSQVMQSDTMVTHGMPVQNAQDYNCLQSSAPDANGRITLASRPCTGVGTQQWVLDGNHLLQGNNCLTGIYGDNVGFMLQDCGMAAYALWHYDGGMLINDSLTGSCLGNTSGNAVRETCSTDSNQWWFLGGN